MLQTSEPPESLTRVVNLSNETKRRLARTRLDRYRPYAKQAEFHEAGAVWRERLFMASNQSGKTYAGAAEMAMHLTGLYPAWWTGRRFTGPITALAGSESAELTRKGIQTQLLGTPEDEASWGTGAIPGAYLKDWNRRPGVSNAVDTIMIHHAAGGMSVLLLNSYDQGRTKWQAATADLVWFDEEPPEEIYFEGLTRTNAVENACVYMTFTPLLGMSSIVRRFRNERVPGTTVINMTIDDAEHISDARREEIIAGYPEHEREARTLGIPSLGEGRIFQVAERDIVTPAFPIPKHWARIGGIDFGFSHPTGAVELAWDRDADVVYLTKAYRQRHATPVIHAAALKAWSTWMPWAWPSDGMAHSKGGDEPLAAQYQDHGLQMLMEHAQFEGGSVSVWAGITEMQQRMETGRFKVFEHCEPFLDEFRSYHMKGGKVVKEVDDVIDATRYALMMLRYAETEPVAMPKRSMKWVY